MLSDSHISVSCCELDGSDGVRPDCNAYSKTYDEAVQLCADHHYRLCTKSEIEAKITNGKGCQFDYRYNWVSDECTTSTGTVCQVVNHVLKSENTPNHNHNVKC